MYVFTYLDITYQAGIHSPFIDLLTSDSVIKMFFWGLTEQATSFVLIYILPVLLAIKFRTKNELSTMGGTIFGVLTTMSYLVSTACFSIFA